MPSARASGRGRAAGTWSPLPLGGWRPGEKGAEVEAARGDNRLRIGPRDRDGRHRQHCAERRVESGGVREERRGGNRSRDDPHREQADEGEIAHGRGGM
eukprot:scaffold265931_cov29-Tisochrysis_lutea.AAC.1